MAARDHRVSRRALLGAAVLSLAEGPLILSLSKDALPLARHAGLDPGSTSFLSEPERWIPDQVRNDERWPKALARFRRAEALLEAHAHDPDEDRYDRLNAAFHRALRKLIRTPAPDLRALSTKIDLAIDQEIATLTGGEACLAVLKRDARRLSLS